MVKRRKLEAPSPEDLNRYEEEFRRETRSGMAAPIAQIAAQSAGALTGPDTEQRAARARNEAEAAQYRSAQARGLVMLEIPLSDIAADAMLRDRTVLDRGELEELKSSIAASGMRLPIEVFEAAVDARAPYGLLSGYRRLLAVQELLTLTGAEAYRTIRALVRPAASAGSAFASMVEENEVRAPLSHFERGRIAVMAAKQGAFVNTEDAVARMFPVASKAKRSKVRSFALIFEELGDMLSFPESLTEKQGLRLASALRDGAEPRLREVLASGHGDTAEAEWVLLDAAISGLGPSKSAGKRGGRPKSVPATGWQDNHTLRLSNGIVLSRESDSRGHLLRFEGRGVDSEMMDNIMIELQNLLERP